MTRYGEHDGTGEPTPGQQALAEARAALAVAESHAREATRTGGDPELVPAVDEARLAVAHAEHALAAEEMGIEPPTGRHVLPNRSPGSRG
jgi:hypothetical protein